MGALKSKQAEVMKCILNTRTKLRLGIWNIRTMYDTGKQAQTLSEMKNIKLHGECR